MSGEIHEEHPFIPPEDAREPIRRLRGRLVAPVTIVTAGDSDDRAGLTISSLMIAEGGPGMVTFLLGPTADLYDVVVDSGRLVVHVLESHHRALSDVFAARRPSPGGPFAGLDLDQTSWGPVISSIPNRAFCSVASLTEAGYSMLVAAMIDEVHIEGLSDPLVYFRGHYRGLSE